MNFGPGSSAILDLKAELLRKKTQNESKPIEKIKDFDVRKGGFKIEKREPKKPRTLDAPPEDDGFEEALRESRANLERKARLYDERVNEAYTEETEDTVIDFNRKRGLERQRKREGVSHDYDAEDDSDWTSFVDSLGRTRKCLKSDLSHYQREDQKLRREIDPEDLTPEGPVDDIPMPEPTVEDAAKEERERRWNLIEEENNAKDQLHYRDVLFDEIREHGQAHFEFSRDDSERAHQMKILERLREDSTNAQRASQAIKRRREEILKERMKKIRMRKGLPPEEEKSETDQSPADIPLPPMPPPPPPPSKSVPSSSHIRPWDEGKEVHGVPLRAPRRNYIDERRSEREPEFAPPSSYEKLGWKRSTEPRGSDVDDFLENIRDKS